jgi:hypothetical protein
MVLQNTRRRPESFAGMVGSLESRCSDIDSREVWVGSTSQRYGVGYEAAEQVIAHLCDPALSRVYGCNEFPREKRAAFEAKAVQQFEGFISGGGSARTSRFRNAAGMTRTDCSRALITELPMDRIVTEANGPPH